MVKMGNNGKISRVIDDGKYSRRQDAPKVYNMTTVAYVARKNYIKDNDNMWKGKSKWWRSRKKLLLTLTQL